MPKKMLIDASHTEEKRVAVLDQNRLDEYDVETLTKKQNKGNVYLAKVVRIEPSLQAAFVEYGGNRHGFLAFDEIHPDYYQIPIDDREKLKKEMMALQKASAAKDEEEEDTDEDTPPADKTKGKKNKPAAAKKAKKDEIAQTAEEEVLEEVSSDLPSDPQEDPLEEGEESEEPPPAVEVVSDDDDVEDEIKNVHFHSSLLRRYKIQEVIRRGQIILIQVVKEERGNKGAALTSYLSLAGRYCVLMPNNERGGGVSRKINIKDRKRLKSIIDSLDVPEGMSIIIRTAGKDQNKKDILKDYEYLIKVWTTIREKTLNSIAPALIYEEGDLIKRALRDMYSPDIDEILIQGEEELKNVKAFVKLLMPSLGKKIKPYKDDKASLFQKYQIENQLEALHNPTAHLKSGGYLVINQTEALVAIDVNSGRATKERNIEETALRTNLEAAEEIARQLRLRDLAGLIVIDFIDMEEMRNNHIVERALKEALRKDRARVQIGRISGFGLLELSRQRLQSSFIETNYLTCPYCKGRGVVRSISSAALHALRVIEEEAIRAAGQLQRLNIFLPAKVALYVLNHLREDITRVELANELKVNVSADDALLDISGFRLERIRHKQQNHPQEKGQKTNAAQHQDRDEAIQSEKDSFTGDQNKDFQDRKQKQDNNNNKRSGSGLFGNKRKGKYDNKRKNNTPAADDSAGERPSSEEHAPSKTEILFDSHSLKTENGRKTDSSQPAAKEETPDASYPESDSYAPKKSGWWKRSKES